MKLSLFFLAVLVWAQEPSAPPPKHEPTVAELKAENVALRAYIDKMEPWYGASIRLLQIQHDAVVNACIGQPPQKPVKPETK